MRIIYTTVTVIAFALAIASRYWFITIGVAALWFIVGAADQWRARKRGQG